MHAELWLAFVAASIVLLVLPGPTILTVISYSISHGRPARLPLVAAVALGDTTALVLSLFGLGALLAASGAWFAAVKWAGGLYLLVLGVKLLRAGSSPLTVPVARGPVSRWELFASTYLVTALNPKGLVFFVAFLPQFIDASRPAGPQLWLVGATFVVLATTNALMYALFASAARRFLGSPRARRGFHLLGGSLLSAAGVWALLARRAV